MLNKKGSKEAAKTLLLLLLKFKMKFIPMQV